MSTDLAGIPGFHNVSKDEAKRLIQPVIGIDGYYLLRPTDDPKAICTICVCNRQKLMNYKLMIENQTRLFYIRDLKFPSVSALIHHYNQYPLNPEMQTKLLYPVTCDQGEEYVALEPARPEPPPARGAPPRNPSVRNPPARIQPNFPNSENPPALPDRPRPGSGERMRQPLPQPAPALPDARRNRTLPPPNRRDSNPHDNPPPLSPNNEVIENLPGVHVDVSKNHVQIILAALSSRDSSYLVRPSASSKGQFTISLTYDGSILNFKINRDPNDGKYFVTPKKKFSTVRELLETHKTNPLKSKARAGAKIYLLHPITANEIQTVMEMMKNQQEIQLPPSTGPPPLPAPWKEYFDKNHQRPYYYNSQTKQTVWERPKAAETRAANIRKANTIDNRSTRQLPRVPEEATGGPRRTSDPIAGRNQRTLPQLPPKNPSTSFNQGGGDSNTGKTTHPMLPPKDSSPAQPPNNNAFRAGPIPKLPPKDMPGSPSNFPPLPPKDPSCAVPPLPNKVPSLPKKDSTPPPLPRKDPLGPPSSTNGFNPSSSTPSNFPPLPPKELSVGPGGHALAPPPPLPAKEPSIVISADPNSGPSTNRQRPIEYEDTVFPSPNTQRSIVNAPLPPPVAMMNANVPPPPPVPQVGDSSTLQPTGTGAPPPAPPIPPNGIPGPPPLPPTISPSASPSLNSLKKPKAMPSPAPEPSGGRPFSANDLLQQRTRLKQMKEEEVEPRQKSGSFLENTLSSAIELRLGSIRNAMDDSDEDTDIEEVDDDDWD